MITSPRNPRVSALKRLHRRRARRETGQTLLEGPTLVAEAVAGGVELVELFATAEDRSAVELGARVGLTPTLIAPAVLSAISDTVTPRGPVGVIRIPESDPLLAVDTVVLWEIGDPGNAGTMIRTAAAFGWNVAATDGCVDLWAPKVLRAAAGAHFRTRLTTDLPPVRDGFTAAGLRTFVATARGDPAGLRELQEATGPVAVVIGNEAHGVPRRLLTDPAVATVAVPMPGGTESLNAAVAAGILLFVRQESRSGR
jgi:TrmH family RNA methyltransferase